MPSMPKVKKLIVGIEGIYIKSFDFKKEGGYAPADLEKVRAQLKAPEWSRIVGIQSSGENEHIEVWARSEKGKVSGVAILASEPRQLTVCNLVGDIDLETLADLGGHVGRPNRPKATKKKERRCGGTLWGRAILPAAARPIANRPQLTKLPHI